MKVNKLITKYSCSNIIVRYTKEAGSVVKIKQPNEFPKSSPPLGGKIQLTCTDPDTKVKHTSGHDFSMWYRVI